MIDVDIVIPTYGNYEQICSLVESFEHQQKVNINKIICPLTLCEDDEINQKIRDLFQKKNVTFFELTPKEFSHSLTREKAIIEYATSEIVILLSQDVILIDELSLFNLVCKIDDEIIYTYGKQVCLNNSIEKYIREKNYPSQDKIISKKDIEELQFMAFFASDAFSALNRNKFIELGGYQKFDVMMNEDQLYSKFLLDAGYKKMYCSNAVVNHSHKYTLKQLYRRYYETGIFYQKVKLFDEYKMNGSGMALALYILKNALKHFDMPVLLRWFPDMSARYLGMKKGKKRYGSK